MESFSHQYLCILNSTVLMLVTRFSLLLEMHFGPFNLSKYLAGGEFLEVAIVEDLSIMHTYRDYVISLQFWSSCTCC